MASDLSSIIIFKYKFRKISYFFSNVWRLAWYNFTVKSVKLGWLLKSVQDGKSIQVSRLILNLVAKNGEKV